MTPNPRAVARPLALFAAALCVLGAAAGPARAAAAPVLTISVASSPAGPVLHLDGSGAAEDVYVFDLNDSPPMAEIDLTAGTIVRSGVGATTRCQAPTATSVKCDLTGLAPPAADKRPIVVDLGAGDDDLVVDDGSEILPVLARGGAGADTIDTTMSSDDDLVFGDDGDDTLVTGDGDDAITGGAGSDTVDAGDGDDVVNLAGDGTWTGFAASDPDAAAKCGPGDDVILRSAGTIDPLADASCEVDVDPLDAPLTVTGTAGVGQTLSVGQTFSRTAPTSRTYSWQRCTAITNTTTGDGTGCTPFATGSTAGISGAQVGGFIRVEASTTWVGARGAVTVTAPVLRTWSTIPVPAASAGPGAVGAAGQTTVVWSTHPSPGVPLPKATPAQERALEDSAMAGPLGQMLTAGKARHGFFKTRHGAVVFSSAGYPSRAGGKVTLVLTAAREKRGKVKTTKATAPREIGRATAAYATAATLKVKLARPFSRTLEHGRLTSVTATATAVWPDGRSVTVSRPIKLQG